MYLPCRLHLVWCHIIQCRSCHIAPHQSCESHIGWDWWCGLHIAGSNPLKGFHRCNCPSKKVAQISPKFLLKRCVTLCLHFLLKKNAFWDWNHGQMRFFQSWIFLFQLMTLLPLVLLPTAHTLFCSTIAPLPYSHFQKWLVSSHCPQSLPCWTILPIQWSHYCLHSFVSTHAFPTNTMANITRVSLGNMTESIVSSSSLMLIRRRKIGGRPPKSSD